MNPGGVRIHRPTGAAKKTAPPTSSAVEQFVGHLPTRPYCTDDLGSGLQIRPRSTAIKKAYIQQNGPGILWWLIFDVDRPGAALAWEQGDLAPPNFIAVNRENAHAHLAYLLSSGVCKTAAAREKPLRYAVAIERAMTTRLGADHGYAGLITKNPLHPRWRVWKIHERSYTLGELAEYLDLRAVRGAANDSVMPAEAHGLGRNCALFDAGRVWAYSAVRDHWGPNGQELWHKVVLAHLAGINDQFQAPLPVSEVKATARSIAKWTWRRITPDTFHRFVKETHASEVQSRRGIRSGKVRRAARTEARANAQLMRAQGKSVREIAQAFGVHHATIVRWTH